jgi:hypothetical protein
MLSRFLYLVCYYLEVRLHLILYGKWLTQVTITTLLEPEF